MKKLVVALAMVAALVVPAAATADPPVKYPTPVPDFEDPANTACSFATQFHFDPNRGFEIDHYDRDGSFRWAWGGGHNVTRVTNASNQHSVTLNTTGPGKITVGDDGSLTIVGSGHWLVAYFPTDSPSSSLIYYSGHIRLYVSPTGQLSLVSYVGAAPQDVCAMIE